MRGKLRTCQHLVSWTGNIPAYAGKTFPLYPHCRLQAEHPRVCGENSVEHIRAAKQCGTSPRMRGKLGFAFVLHFFHRNIPAYAGKTLSAAAIFGASKEHPRVCGENLNGTLSTLSLNGTSPRMRGKPGPLRGNPLTRRNIPAYAGKTGVHTIAHQLH